MEFTLFVAGIGLLAFSCWLRGRQPPLPEPEAQCVASRIDTAAIAPCLEVVRKSYVDLVRSRRETTPSHEELLNDARKAVRNLSFFRARRSEAR